MSRRRIAIWIGGPLLLLSLNFIRDTVRLQTRYDWSRIERGPLCRGVSAAGVMEAAKVADIKSEVDETVEKKMVQEGQEVKAGQPLLELSRMRTELEYQQKKNSNASIDADYRKAVRELAVQRKLFKNMAVSRQQVEDAQQTAEKTKAALSISTQELAIVKNKLDSTLVRSPMNGVVLKDLTKLGASVTVGRDIMTVGDVSKFIVRTKVDELDITQVRPDQRVEIVADAFPGKTLMGKVATVASQAERETFAKVEVVIDIVDSRGLALKHNLSVRVNIVTDEIPEALSVPIKSVIRKEGDNGWVIVRNRLHLLSDRRVKLGPVGGERVQVLSGIDAGEAVGSERAPDAL